MDANTKMSLSYDITFESFISTLRTLVTNADKVNLSLPPNQTTNMILRISSQFLSLNQHANECTRHFLINELLPKVELSPVKQLFLNLLNEYPPNYQHHPNPINPNNHEMEMHIIEDTDDHLQSSLL